MTAKELSDEIISKKQKVKDLSVTIEVYAMKPVSREIKAKEEELKARLQFRLAELELQGLNAKIKIMRELVDVLKSQPVIQ